MTYLVASLTLDSANSYVMQGASCIQRKISMVLFSTPFVLSWGGSISSDSFLPSILLLVVIVVTVVIVVVILIVVVVAIVRVVIVVVIIGVVVVYGDVSSVLKLSFVIIAVTFPSILLGNPPMKTSMSFSELGTMFGHKTANSWNLLIPGDLIGLFYSNRLGVCIPPRQGIISQGVSLGSVFLLGLSKALDEKLGYPLMIISRDEHVTHLSGGGVIDLTSDEDPTDEDEDTGMDDSTGVLASLGGEISSGERKY
nr:hypothetical protein [Tanacetum cinerariifolium]